MPEASCRPSVAVVIPAYNAARFIGRALSSARAQTYPLDEIVVVDDGSSDGTAQAATAEAEKLVLLTQANSGPSAARNLGVRHTRSKLIAFLDADDEWLPNAVETMVQTLVEQPRVALVTADKRAIDEHGRELHKSWQTARRIASRVAAWASQPVPNAVAELARQNFVNTSVVLLRRSAFCESGGFNADLRYGEDLELWARIASRHPIVCLPYVLGMYRLHSGATTRATEQLLRGLVRTSDVFAEWAAGVLAQQGGSARRLTAAARADLGYWLFCQGRHAEARHVLARSMIRRPSARALRYLVLSCFPEALIRTLRESRG